MFYIIWRSMVEGGVYGAWKDFEMTKFSIKEKKVGEK